MWYAFPIFGLLGTLTSIQPYSFILIVDFDAFRAFPVKKKLSFDSNKRERDGGDRHTIAKIPSCEKHVRDLTDRSKWQSRRETKYA